MVLYRGLTSNEIKILENQNCTCDTWDNIEVVLDFKVDRIKNSEFSGNIKLGKFEKIHKLWGGVEKKCGIYNAKIHNCTIHDNVLINKVSNYIANYVIENDVIINNVGILAVNRKSTFGNGTEVEVLNEAGGREVLIFDNLSSQVAYLLTFYRHRPKMVKNINNMINKYCEEISSTVGVIGKNTHILNSRSIRNMKIGGYAVIQDTEVLENGTIISKKDSPVYIGPGVYAKDFICQTNSIISDGAVISKCFIGQGCEISKQFSAENSLFFANCGCFHGEACSIFAGPYTVTHHKSTLLIAGYFSFFNAGSGSNQSNHMYKLGPCHQGILERGAKTASDSYLLFPVKVGPFSLVMGRHYKHSDISNLPYSYLIESNDESILIPGVNLKSVGTIRDAGKWPKRDKRKNSEKLDLINYDLLNPYIVNKLINGTIILKSLQKNSGKLSDFYTYNNVKIKNSSLKNGLKFYKTGLIKFLGNTLINRIQNCDIKSINDLEKSLSSKTKYGKGQWADIAGMFLPMDVLNKSIESIENEDFNSIEDIENNFKKIHANYKEYKWNWVLDNLIIHLGKAIEKITPDDLIKFIKKWMEVVTELDNQYLKDCKKEFSSEIMVGYGIDGNEEISQKDFQEVRGDFETNKFVQTIKNHKIDKKNLGNKIIEKLLIL